jgi:SAM-dependent methyltransferase
MTDSVHAQYEAYPYPARDPAEEAERLIVGSPSHLLELDHFVFAGRRDPAAPFRVLVAGGGTGDGAIMLAQQLTDTGCPAEVTYVDMSVSSRSIAEARAGARGLTNLDFHTMAIEAIPGAGLGPFDYIDCCGVLHHLEDPGAGLAALVEVLAEHGGLGMMVYGELGRTGVYPMQDMMRMLAADDGDAAKVALARRLVTHLPATNWLKRNPFVGDHLEGDDAGLCDLLLHGRDRAYRVGEIADLADRAGLAITAFVEPARYDPASYISDPAINRRLEGLAWIERCAFAELLAGNMRKHVFYAVRKSNPGPCVADPEDAHAVPYLHDTDAQTMAATIKPGGTLSATMDGLTLRFPLPRLAPAMVSRMDARRTLGEIHGELAEANRDLDWEAFSTQFRQLFAALNGIGKLFLSLPRPRV